MDPESKTEPPKEFLGRWKSGRTWKVPQTCKASKKVVTRGVKGHSWEEKLAKRQQQQMEKSLLSEIKEGRQAAREEEKVKRAERKKRRLESQTRALNTHQVILNSNKLRRMSKKERAKLVKK